MATILLSRKDAGRMGVASTSPEDILFEQIQTRLKEVPVRNALFHPTRKWRADFLFSSGLIVEVDGGIWKKPGGRRCVVCRQVQAGAHGTGKGIMRDIEKSNEAQRLGYLFIRIPSDWIVDSRGEPVTKGIDYLAGFFE